jgi:3-(3-hydroxy-phenyl)propionate hydroxylase
MTKGHLSRKGNMSKLSDMSNKRSGTDTYDVLIVGYGPVGATLALFLSRAGWRTAIIERDHAIYPMPRAVHLEGDTLRTFQAAGLRAELRPALGAFSALEFVRRDGTLLFTYRPEGKQFHGCDDDYWFHQPQLEGILRQAVDQRPRVEVLTGHEATALAQDDDGVRLTIHDGATGETRTLRGAFLIGCDGGRSFIRAAAGITLHDHAFDQPWLVVDTFLEEGVSDTEAGLPHVNQQFCDPRRPITYVAGVGNHRRFEFMLLDGETKEYYADPAHLTDLLSQVCDTSKVTIGRWAVYTFHALLAKQWRVGRVLLAGDAAHQMPPFAGQGMCSGIRDVHNLAWKLDLVLRGAAPLPLLDTYQSERAPHVKTSIRRTMLAGRIIQSRQPAIVGLRDLFFRAVHRIPGLHDRLVRLFTRAPLPGKGVFARRQHGTAKTFFPQPRVRLRLGETVPLDTVLGDGFAVIGLDRDPAAELPAPSQAIWRTLPHRFVRLATPATRQQSTAHPAPPNGHSPTVVVEDPSGTLAAWFRQHKAEYVIVRPDRTVFGAYRRAGWPAAPLDLARALGLDAVQTAPERSPVEKMRAA